MSIKFQCLCGQPYTVANAFASTGAVCASCGRRMQIPSEQTPHASGARTRSAESKAVALAVVGVVDLEEANPERTALSHHGVAARVARRADEYRRAPALFLGPGRQPQPPVHNKKALSRQKSEAIDGDAPAADKGRQGNARFDELRNGILAIGLLAILIGLAHSWTFPALRYETDPKDSQVVVVYRAHWPGWEYQRFRLERPLDAVGGRERITGEGGEEWVVHWRPHSQIPGLMQFLVLHNGKHLPPTHREAARQGLIRGTPEPS